MEVHSANGATVFADKAAARNNGQELTFEGHVKTHVIPQNDPQPGAEANKAAP